MGFGLGRKRKIQRLGGRVRPLNGGRARAVGRPVTPIDTRIRPVGRRVSGTSGIGGRVGRPVRPINRRTKGADDIFDVDIRF